MFCTTHDADTAISLIIYKFGMIENLTLKKSANATYVIHLLPNHNKRQRQKLGVAR